MQVEEFKLKVQQLIQRVKFKKLLSNRASQNSPAGLYLKSRGLTVSSLECYDFSGEFEYQGTKYQLPECIVIPLRSSNFELIGVWIRFLRDKRFYIWQVPGKQKFWLSLSDENDKKIYVAESIFDALSLQQIFGFKNIAACLGVSVSTDLQSQLKGYEVVLCFDRDTAGCKGMLNHLNSDVTSMYKIIKLDESLVDLSEFKDYNDIHKSFLTKELNLSFTELAGIQAKIFLKSKI